MTNIIKANSFESGNPSGTAMTSGSGGNTGGGAGDWLANVYASTGGAALFTSGAFVGSLAGLARLTASAGTTFGFRTTALGHSELYFRGYLKLNNVAPPATVFLITARDNAATSSGFSIRLSATGFLSVYKRSATAATLATMDTALTAGTWYLVEGFVSAAGVWELRCATAANPWVAYATTVSGTGVTTGLTFFDYLNYGAEMSTGMATLDAVWDEIGYGSDWLGPVAGGTARPIEDTGAVNMTPTGVPTLREAVSDQQDTTYGATGVLSGTPSYTETRLSNLGPGSVRFGSRVYADSSPGVTCVISLRQGATVVATRTQANIPNAATTYEYVCTGPEEAAITDRENLRIRTSFTG